MPNKFLKTLLLASLLLIVGARPAFANSLIPNSAIFEVRGTKVYTNDRPNTYPTNRMVGSFVCHAFWDGFYTMTSLVDPYKVMSGPISYSGTIGLVGQKQEPFAIPVLGRKPGLISVSKMAVSNATNMLFRANYIGYVTGSDGKLVLDGPEGIPLGGIGPSGTPAQTTCPMRETTNPGFEPVLLQQGGNINNRVVRGVKKVAEAIYRGAEVTAVVIYTVTIGGAVESIRQLFN